MSSSSAWVRKKKFWDRLWLAVVLVGVVGVVGLVLRNNPELMATFKWAPSRPSTEHKKEAPQVKQPAEPAVVEKAEFSEPAKPAEPAVADKAKFSEPAARGSLILERVDCRLLDRPDLVVYVSLNLVFSHPALKDEILLKRESLRTLLRAVVAGKRLEEIVVEPLRIELKSRFNRVLQSGAIEDIEFRDFRIDSRNGSSE